MNKKVLLLPKNISQLRLLPNNHIPTLRLNPKPPSPSCKNCIFSVIETSNTKKPNLNQLKCTKFFAKNRNNNYFEYDYEYASECRDDNTKCGKHGRYFIPINAYY